MKIKTTILGLSLTLFASMSAQAQEEKSGEKSGEKFAAHKTEMLGHLNKEKSAIDAAISCINSATKKEDAEKCHEQKKASMDSMRQEREASHKKRMAEKKERLQKELKEIDEKSAETSNKK